LHRIVAGRWSPAVNWLVVECTASGASFETRADRFRVACPHCGAVGSIETLRERYARERGRNASLTPARDNKR
jgi:predicted RNA-binding Zn-ribbon protein involved in translation (DUF1610 family)